MFVFRTMEGRLRERMLIEGRTDLDVWFLEVGVVLTSAMLAAIRRLALSETVEG